ncbi:flagellar protein FlaG [Salidesulfovibrio onnuriiensis]|uniref:flagellar protein FlaG n=1 Tax=Salidesulfovibrio onnuriiensis TaxID=2583823 RepID=UPI0011CB8BB1|nr:flagellar protein FlaG [Salidesulfovibrio onnuriiensis]
MNIPEIKTDVKPAVRADENTVVRTDGKSVSPRSGVQENYVVDKIEKTNGEQKQQARLNKKTATDVAKQAESELASQNLKLKFNVIEENNTIQVEVRDADDKVIKKIPADDIVKLTKSIREHFPGSFVDKTF